MVHWVPTEYRALTRAYVGRTVRAPIPILGVECVWERQKYACGNCFKLRVWVISPSRGWESLVI